MNSLKLGVILALIFLLGLSQSEKLEITDITDSTIDTIVGDGKGKHWLLLFYLETCPYCKVAKESLISLVGKKEIVDEADSSDLQIGKIECNANQFACMRFNITRVPYIVQLHNDMMFEFDQYPSDDRIFQFITDEKTVGSGLPIPPPYGYLGIVFKLFEEAVKILNENIQDFITNTLKLNIEWNSYFTVAMLISCLLIFLTTEYIVISFFFGKKKSKPNENKSDESKPEESDKKPKQE